MGWSIELSMATGYSNIKSTSGIAAAYLGNFDFIYAAPGAWLSTPFSFLGITSEGVASSMFLDRSKPVVLYICAPHPNSRNIASGASESKGGTDFRQKAHRPGTLGVWIYQVNPLHSSRILANFISQPDI
jgi:hypothetical protein